MSCQAHRQTLLDLARGAVPAGKSAAAAQGHAAECPACGGWLTEQQRLTVSLRALARDTRVAAPAEMQRRLETAFDVYHAATRRAARDWMKWSAAAAVVICAIGLGVWRLRPAPSPAAGAQSSRPSEQARRTDTPAVTTAPSIAPPREFTVSAPNRPFSRPARPTLAAAERPFVAIPAAAALPPLESAQIFRVEVPVGALPAYGFDIAPDAAGSYVAADVLVGQDGQPRAIRLVNSDQSAGSTR
jgi:hypothetical protein